MGMFTRRRPPAEPPSAAPPVPAPPSASAPPPAAAPRPPAASTSGTAERLADRLREIGHALAAPEDAFEPALRAILEAIGAAAGAICLYDQRHQLLRLAAEVGLSDEGCRCLRTVRRGDAASWDMPLHGLLNRRAYLIESAARNRYVPPLVEGAAAVRTVACLPVYAGSMPLGSLVLVTTARSFEERDIRTLEQPLREIAVLIEAVRRRGGAASAAPPPPPPPPAAAAREAETERLRAELDAAAAERVTLAAELGSARAEAARLEEARAQVSAEAQAAAALAPELDALKLRVAEAEAEAARERQTRVELEATLARGASEEQEALRQALEAARAAEAERGGLAAELERARAEATRVEPLTAALAAAEAEQARLTAAVAEATSQATAAEARTAELTAQATAQEARTAELTAQATAAEARATELAAQATAAEARATELATQAAQLDELRTRLREAEGDAGRERLAREELEVTLTRGASEEQEALRQALEAARAAEAERAGLAAELEQVRAEATRVEPLTAALAAAEAEQARLTAAVAEATSQATAAEARAAELEAQAIELDELRLRLGEVEAEAVRERRAREELEATAAHDASDELEAARAALASARALIEERQEDLARAHERIARLEADGQRALAERDGELESLREAQVAEAVRLETLEAERDELRTALSALKVEREGAAAARASYEAPRAGEPRPAPAPEAPVRVVPMAPSGTRAGAPAVQPGRQLVLVLDAEQAWEATAVDGHQVAMLPPGDDLPARLAEMTPARVIVNLASRGALDALAALRAAGCTARFWGCLARPEAPRALPLGMVEPAARPLDPDAVVASLASYATRGTRVVTVGADVDALVSLRQALARQGLSVSMAWDAKQAADLFTMVRPEIVVLDLELPRDAHATVARLAASDPIPHAVLIAGGEDAAAGFAAALADPAYAARMLPLGQLVAKVLTRSETPASERR